MPALITRSSSTLAPLPVIVSRSFEALTNVGPEELRSTDEFYLACDQIGQRGGRGCASYLLTRFFGLETPPLIGDLLSLSPWYN